MCQCVKYVSVPCAVLEPADADQLPPPVRECAAYHLLGGGVPGPLPGAAAHQGRHTPGGGECT